MSFLILSINNKQVHLLILRIYFYSHTKYLPFYVSKRKGVHAPKRACTPFDNPLPVITLGVNI